MRRKSAPTRQHEQRCRERNLAYLLPATRHDFVRMGGKRKFAALDRIKLSRENSRHSKSEGNYHDADACAKVSYSVVTKRTNDAVINECFCETSTVDTKSFLLASAVPIE